MVSRTFKKYNLILYLIWPLAGLYYAFKHKKLGFIKTFLPIFTGVLGYTYQPQEGADVNLSIEKFESYKHLNVIDKIQHLYNSKLTDIVENGLEIYLDLIAFFTSIFTDNYKWSLFILGYVYGITLYKFYKELFKNYEGTNSLFYKILFISVFLFIQPSMALNGRFWLSTLFLLYFVVAYYNNPKIKYVLYSLLLIFIHKGMLAAGGLFFIWHFSKQIRFRKYIYMLILIISIVTPGSFALNYVRENVENISDVYKEQARGYTHEEYIDKTSNVLESRSTTFRVYTLKNVVLFYAAFIFLVYLYIKRYLFVSENIEQLFYLSILFISFSNFFIDVPSLGSRYRFIASGIMLLLIYLTLKQVKINHNSMFKNILLLGLIFSFIISLRMEFEQLYGFIYMLNPLIAYAYYQDVTIMELIR